MDQEPIIVIGQFSLSAILFALVCVGINHLLANTRNAKNKRTDQGRKVIDMFCPELDGLIQTENDARFILTTDAFRKHESAIRNFLPYLSWFSRFRMHIAWKKLAYHKDDKKAQMPFYEQYADCGSLDKRARMRLLAIFRIQRIVSLAGK